MGKAQTLRAALTLGGDALIAATLAPGCASCHRALDMPLRGPVCPRCWDEAAAADGRYEGSLRNVIHAFKYEGRRSLARQLATQLRDRHGCILDDADCVVPVPLFPWRRLRRGFNQAAELAKHLDRPVVNALWRVRATASQTGLTAAQRRRNVSGAFRLSPLLSASMRGRYLTDRVVVLVDDVMTTGATLNACAEVLRHAGAREIRILTIARAPLQGKPTRINAL